MKDKIEAFKAHVIKLCETPSFRHTTWFVKWHLNFVEQIASELLEHYPTADRDAVMVLVWLHDYGKMIDFGDQYRVTLTEGRKALEEHGFDPSFIEKVLHYTDLMNRSLELDIKDTPLEVQIISSADGCAHFVGPFFSLWWYENPGKPFLELMSDNKRKALKDWNKKIVIPEAREAFKERVGFLMEQSGEIPERFIKAS